MTQNNEPPHDKIETENGVILQDAKRRSEAIKSLSTPNSPGSEEWL
jgi:hypothetical protein